ncbi:hypothetical protein C5C57_15930 [Rathayibacter sp. AY1C5]|nr:hypothetical protein C5C57_15930 [Rathayibacter sp. AY1C5]
MSTLYVPRRGGLHTDGTSTARTGAAPGSVGRSGTAGAGAPERRDPRLRPAVVAAGGRRGRVSRRRPRPRRRPHRSGARRRGPRDSPRRPSSPDREACVLGRRRRIPGARRRRAITGAALRSGVLSCV